MEQLRQYLERKELSLRMFAPKVETSAATLSRIMRGERLPDLRLAFKIQEATNGYVKAKDWIPR